MRRHGKKRRLLSLFEFYLKLLLFSHWCFYSGFFPGWLSQILLFRGWEGFQKSGLSRMNVAWIFCFGMDFLLLSLTKSNLSFCSAWKRRYDEEGLGLCVVSHSPAALGRHSVAFERYAWASQVSIWVYHKLGIRVDRLMRCWWKNDKRCEFPRCNTIPRPLSLWLC